MFIPLKRPARLLFCKKALFFSNFKPNKFSTIEPTQEHFCLSPNIFYYVFIDAWIKLNTLCSTRNGTIYFLVYGIEPQLCKNNSRNHIREDLNGSIFWYKIIYVIFQRGIFSFKIFFDKMRFCDIENLACRFGLFQLASSSTRWNITSSRLFGHSFQAPI